MDFFDPPPANYDPETSRALIEAAAHGLEVENAFHFPHWLKKPWLQRADAVYPNWRQATGKNVTLSLYFDTPNLDFYANGIVMRVRNGGEEKNSDGLILKTYPNQFSLKCKNWQYSGVAQAIAARHHPKHKFPIIVRTEIEGAHDWHSDLTALRYQDLPDQPYKQHKLSILDAVSDLVAKGKISGVSKREDIVLIPWGLTAVQRMTAWFYVEPNKEYDFKNAWPAMSPDELTSKDYVCVEVVLDENSMKRCPPNASINEIFSRLPRNKLGKRDLLEMELVAEKSSPTITDDMAISLYTELQNAFVRYDHEIASKRPHGRSKSQGFVPATSKSTTTFGLHAECRRGGRLHEPYITGRALAA